MLIVQGLVFFTGCFIPFSICLGSNRELRSIVLLGLLQDTSLLDSNQVPLTVFVVYAISCNTEKERETGVSVCDGDVC